MEIIDPRTTSSHLGTSHVFCVGSPPRRETNVKQRSRRGSQPVSAEDNKGSELLPLLDASEVEFKPKELQWRKINWQLYTKSGNLAIAFWLGVTLSAILLWTTITSFRSQLFEASKSTAHQSFTVVFKSAYGYYGSEGRSQDLERHGIRLNPLLSKNKDDVDYGGLVFNGNREEFDDPLPIEHYRAAEAVREQLLRSMDDEEEDGSEEENYQPDSNKDYTEESLECRPATWVQQSFPNCNHIHEKLVGGSEHDGYNISYLNSGAYRDAFRFESRHMKVDHFVLKRISLAIETDEYEKNAYKVHNEAILLERLSHSPRILDIYGYCGTSVFVEPMASDLADKTVPTDGFAFQKDLNKLDDVYPRNKLTASEKLQITLEMAKSLADLHGYRDGAIAHSDAKTEQWLIAPDGSIKLNDFNNAKPPLWNAVKEKYCPRYSQYNAGFRFMRSPEEYDGEASSVSADIYALGSDLYPMITGLWPFYDEQSRGVSKQRIKESIIAGKRAYIDPRYRKRSYIERKLVELLERCWEQKRKHRPSIFEVISMLEEVKTKAIAKGELQPSSLINIPMP